MTPPGPRPPTNAARTKKRGPSWAPWNRHPGGDGTPWARRLILRPIFMLLIGRLGAGPPGNMVLMIEDPVSGNRRSGLITPWEFDGGRYFISGNGESRWVRALRAAGNAKMKRGRQVEEITAVELDDEEKLPILRWYATFRIEAENDDALRELAPRYPVFRIS